MRRKGVGGGVGCRYTRPFTRNLLRVLLILDNNNKKLPSNTTIENNRRNRADQSAIGAGRGVEGKV